MAKYFFLSLKTIVYVTSLQNFKILFLEIQVFQLIFFPEQMTFLEQYPLGEYVQHQPILGSVVKIPKKILVKMYYR